MSLHVDVRLVRGSFTLDVDLDLPEGEVLAVLGPNASGKSTLLAVLAGLLRPGSGVVGWRGRELTRAPDLLVPPQRRRVGLLGQDPLLFPHLDVTENVAFGPRSLGHRDAGARAATWLDRLGLTDLAGRRPRELSGGQAARVALARVLAAEPEVLLLDEPLAALDVAAAPGLRHLIADVVRETGTTTVLVSHELLDAVVLADRVAVLREGRVVEQGTRDAVLGAPRTAFTAALVGVNLLGADAVDGGYRTPVGVLRAAGSDGSGGRGGRGGPDGSDGSGRAVTQLRFRPSAVVLSAVPPAGPTGGNRWEAVVRGVEPATGGVRVRLQHAGGTEVLADIDATAVPADLLRPSSRVQVHVPAGALHPV